jgi:phage shock protein PspC (stress-responsive transcriptional regulator)
MQDEDGTGPDWGSGGKFGGGSGGEWHRGSPDRKIAGVCAALAERFNAPLTVVRAAFLVFALPPFSGIGLSLYLALWFLMPPAPAERSGLDRLLEFGRDMLGIDDADDEPASRSERRN